MGILFLIIHIIGAAVSYIVNKKHLSQGSNYWSVGDRAMCIFYSLIGGWLSVIVSYFVEWVYKKDNVKANW